MITNYFKIAWRNLFRNKGFTITNILGLTIGITCTMLILLWVQDELAYNKFQDNYDTVYKVMANRNFNNEITTDENMVLPLAQALEKEVPEVKKAVITTFSESHILSYGETRLKQNGYTVSDHFFDVFSWKFIKGNPATAINDAHSIVITASTAKAFFGDDDPINKVIRVDNAFDAKVTAVVADPPGNSTLRFDYINRFNYDDASVKRSLSDWTNSSWNVYIQTVPGISLPSLNAKITAIKRGHGTDDRSAYFGFPMSKWRLYSDFKGGENTGGMIEYVRLFSIIALIILLIACVNFMNLSTARSEKRAKEVGVRKTLGSAKSQLVMQFFAESILMSCITFIISVCLVYLLLPSFNILVDKQLTLNMADPVFWLQAVAIIVITGIVAGSYPALYLSSFNPVKVLKGSVLTGKKAALPRHILVVIQFVVSIVLISATVIVYQQIQHVKNRETGYNPDRLVMITASGDVNRNFPVIRQELLQSGLVQSMTRSFSPITNIWWRSPIPDFAGKPADMTLLISGESADVDYTKTMGIKVLQGRDFSGLPSDSNAMLLNKAAVEAMGLKEPIGMQMRYGRSLTVVGVIDNVVKGSPFEPVEPMMVFYRPGNGNSVTIRLNGSADIPKALSVIETSFKKHNPAVPFEYQFVDQEFNRKFLAEDRINKIADIFSALAIFICCIGLAGLASFTIEKRIREIGIRKVLGASVQQVLVLVSKEFVWLVLIALALSIPLTWWFMNNWLEQYRFHIDISLWLFVLVGAAVLLLTIGVVTLNALKAATSNPVKSLRTE
jgi:putative ABC transport system permease protein